jgi:transposase
MPPETLAELAHGKLRDKLEPLQRALEGRVKAHHRVLIDTLLQHIAHLEGAIAALDAEIARALRPFERQVVLLLSLPGVSLIAVAIILAEIGADMGRFVSPAHLASWAGVCPGNRQSAGKRLSGKTTGGNVWLRGVLGQVAWAAIRKKGTSCKARYWRIARRQGKQKALVAVMHHLVVVIYRVLQEQVPYRELGPDYYRPGDPDRQRQRLVKHLERLGYAVTLTPQEAA